MKKILSLCLLLLLGANVLFAQRNDEQRKADFEKFKAERQDYITKEVGLTDDEAKKFWPLCNELMEKKFEVNKPLRELRRKFRETKEKGNAISEADYKKMAELSASIKIKEAQLEEEYLKKYLEVISAEKVHKYQHAERDFGQKAMEKWEKEKRNRPSR